MLLECLLTRLVSSALDQMDGNILGGPLSGRKTTFLCCSLLEDCRTVGLRKIDIDMPVSIVVCEKVTKLITFSKVKNSKTLESTSIDDR